MPGTEFTCPKCGASARSPREIATGALVKCPSCSQVFRFGETAVATAEPVRRADDDDRSRRRRSEDDDDDRSPRRRLKDDVAASSLPRDVLTKVKNATTFMLCKFNDGRAGSGSGFFIGRDLVMTNAHVVGMLPPGSQKPKDLDVILNSGMDNEAKCTGK